MKASPMRSLIGVSVLGLLLPGGVRWGIPMIAQQIQQFRSTVASPALPTSTVTQLDGHTWHIQSPNQAPQRIQLAGLQPIAPNWQAQANGISAMLLHASRNQVQVTLLPNSSLALVRLPNGTLIQHILLAQGLARLDPKQQTLPPDIARDLLKAQQTAQQQRKNLWGQP